MVQTAEVEQVGGEELFKAAHSLLLSFLPSSESPRSDFGQIRFVRILHDDDDAKEAQSVSPSVRERRGGERANRCTRLP